MEPGSSKRSLRSSQKKILEHRYSWLSLSWACRLVFEWTAIAREQHFFEQLWKKTPTKINLITTKKFSQNTATKPLYPLSWVSQKPPCFSAQLWMDICVGHVGKGEGEGKGKKGKEKEKGKKPGRAWVSSSFQFGQLCMYLQDCTASIFHFKKVWSI